MHALKRNINISTSIYDQNKIASNTKHFSAGAYNTRKLIIPQMHMKDQSDCCYVQ